MSGHDTGLGEARPAGGESYTDALKRNYREALDRERLHLRALGVIEVALRSVSAPDPEAVDLACEGCCGARWTEEPSGPGFPPFRAPCLLCNRDGAAPDPLRAQAPTAPPPSPVPSVLVEEGEREHGGYRQSHFYTCSEVAAAFAAGAREARQNGGAPDDALIERAADAFVKSVHPVHTATPMLAGLHGRWAAAFNWPAEHINRAQALSEVALDALRYAAALESRPGLPDGYTLCRSSGVGETAALRSASPDGPPQGETREVLASVADELDLLASQAEHTAATGESNDPRWGAVHVSSDLAASAAKHATRYRLAARFLRAAPGLPDGERERRPIEGTVNYGGEAVDAIAAAQRELGWVGEFAGPGEVVKDMVYRIQSLERRLAQAGAKAQSALREHDNIRWDDVCERADAVGDDLGRFTRKYARYVRSDLAAAMAALSPSPATSTQEVEHG